MRVAINLEQLLAPSPGGVGRYGAKLAHHLHGMGVEVLPVVARHNDAEVKAAWSRYDLESLGPPRRLALPRPALYDAWHLVSWPPLVGKGEGADVIHAPSLAVPPRSGRLLAVSVHDAGPWRHPEAFTARGRWFHRAGMRAALRRADVFLTGTQAAADELAELAGVPPERCRVVPYGVDLVGPGAEVPSAEAVGQVLARHGLAGRPYVLWVGSLEPRKGVGTLVAAMAQLAREAGQAGASRRGEGGAGEVALALAGFPGWQHAGLVAPEDEAALGPSLVRVGYVDEAQLKALYHGATLFAFPSRHEGFGLPLLEAMAAGVPVVASDIPALREVAGGAAVLVEAGDVGAWAEALGSLLADGSRRRELAGAGRRRASLFSWEATAKATLGIYQQLLG